MALNTIAIEEALDQLVADVTSGTCTLHDFPFRVMEAFDASRNEVAKLRMKHPAGLAATDILWPKKLLFRAADTGQVQNTIEDLKASLLGKKGAAAKNAPRFLMSTDGDEFLAVDTKTGETPPFDRLADLAVNYDFLLPMFGVERYKPAPETAADVRAARHMAKFHDAIRDANPTWGVDRIHDLNIFMTRLLFCMFAEDTGIFSEKLFVNTLRREAMQIDGSDTQRVIEDIFLSLDVAEKDVRLARGVRSQRVAADFPYVNGGLFRDRTAVPVFNRRARRLLLEAADLHWDQIHADIFGSMIQAIVQTDMRADFGMHYTSVPNIMKVLEPLFLASLRGHLMAAGNSVKALEKLIDRISRIRVFDPACGSGNFLIIAYRELRLIETEAFRRLRDIKREGQLALADFQTGIRISNFYGIDPVDFACETAKLSLWISQYQMNKKLDEICSAPTPALPLTDAGSIVVGNALRKEWTEICPPVPEAETYIVGNPPYLGRPNRNEEQQDDMDFLFSAENAALKNLDYVACWLIKSADYINAVPSAASFVTTNSIFQGEQVPLLWPLIKARQCEFGFAYEPFKWRNSAAKNAGVTCVIVGLREQNNSSKMMYNDTSVRIVTGISPYLTEGPEIYVQRRSIPLTELPKTELGSAPKDDGNLLLSPEEREALIREDSRGEAFIRPFCGSKEFINSHERYCIWIDDDAVEEARTITPIRRRMDAVASFRAASKKSGTQKSADRPHQFDEVRHKNEPFLIIPSVCSEKRPYLTVGFCPAGTVVSNLAFAIYSPPTWAMAALSSRLHIVWAKAVGGQLETRIRYSTTLIYNTFPLPRLSEQQKGDLEEHALNILRIREPYFADGKSIAWLYNPDTMPVDLRQAHYDLDNYLESIYIGRPFRDDAERLEHLFKLYAQMTKKAAKAA